MMEAVKNDQTLSQYLVIQGKMLHLFKAFRSLLYYIFLLQQEW